MLQTVKLKNPPIKEALVSIVFSHPSGIKLKDFDQYIRYLSDKYPDKENQLRNTISVQVESNEVSNDVEPIGYVLSSTDKKNYIRLNVNSLSIHRVEPYESWENLLREVKRNWIKFSELFADIQIEHISVRYVNVISIELSEENLKFEDYLTLLPQIPDTLSNVVDGYFMQIKMPDTLKKIDSVITEFYTINQKQIEITLDINVIKNLDAPIDSTEILWNILSDLRDFKNKIFFNSITETTKKLCNE